MMTNQIDTIEMTRQIRDALYQQLKDLLPTERLTFYRETAQALHQQLNIAAINRPTHFTTQQPVDSASNNS